MLLVNWRTSIPRSTPRRTRPLSTSRDAARGHRLLLAPRQPTKFAKMKSTFPDWGAACAAAAAARRERYGQGRVQRGLPEALWLTSTAQNCHEACEIEESGGGVVRSDAGRDEAPGGCGRCQNRQPAARWRALTRVLGCSARGGARRGRVPRPRARCGQSLQRLLRRSLRREGRRRRNLWRRGPRPRGTEPVGSCVEIKISGAPR